MTPAIRRNWGPALNGISERDAASFAEDGFVVIPEFFTADRIAVLHDAISEILEKYEGTDEERVAIDRIATGNGSPGPPRKIKKVTRLHPAFAAMRVDDRLVAAVRQLLGPDLYCGRSKIEMKPPRVGGHFEWHQDWAYCPYTNDGLLHAAVPLDDMTVDNGGLRMVPGTHRGPIHDHHRDGYFVGGADPAPEVLARAVDIVAPRGSLVMFHTRTLHSSPPNQSDRPRRLLLMEYARGDAWPLLGVSDWDTFAESFVSGSPAIEPLVTDVPRRLPFPGLRGRTKKI